MLRGLIVRLAAVALALVGPVQAQTLSPGYSPGFRPGFQFGRLGGAAAVINWPALAAAKAAADQGNPQTLPLASGADPTVTYSTTAPGGSPYPASNTSLAAYTAAFDIEGGIPFLQSGRVLPLSFSQGGSSSAWSTGTNVRTNGSRVSAKCTSALSTLTTVVVDGGTNAPRWARVLVNGRYTNKVAKQISPGTGFSASYVQLAFPQPLSIGDVVTIEFDVDVTFGQWWGGTFSKPGVSKPTILFLTDSIGAGRINDTTTGYSVNPTNSKLYPAHSQDGQIRRVADYLGVNPIENGIGGTGYRAPNQTTTNAYSRLFTGGDLAAAVASGIQGMVINMGINDASGINTTTYTRAQVQADLATFFNKLASDLVNLYGNSFPVTVSDNWWNTSYSTPNGNMSADIFAAVANAKAAYPGVRLNTYILNDQDNGAGVPPSSGDAVTYKNSDGVHPNTAGEIKDAPINAGRAFTSWQATQ